MAKRKGSHGGRRPGAGRVSYFSGKKAARQFSVVFTALGLRKLDEYRKHLKASRSDYCEALVLACTNGMIALDAKTEIREHTGKLPNPFALVFSVKGRVALDRLVRTSGKSRSNVIESLILGRGHAITADTMAELAA